MLTQHLLAVTVYRNGVHWAGGEIHPVYEGDNMMTLGPRNSPAWETTQVRLLIRDERHADPRPGWATAECSVILTTGIPAGAASASVLPITFYVGEPTDWHTGIARFCDGYPVEHIGDRHLGVGRRAVTAEPAPVWSLTLRRAR